MDANNITLLFRYESHVAVKVAFPNTRMDTLLEFVCRKWNFMEQRSIKFTYHIDGVGDCYLTEDDDIPTLFLMTRRYSLEQIEVQVHLNDGPAALLPEVHNNQPVLNSVFQSQSITLGDQESAVPVVRGRNVKDRLSASWSNLIDYEGQEFPGGANEFRKSLIKFSTELGFDYKYVRNEPERITAECIKKKAANCGWMVHAIKRRNSNEMVIRKFNKIHSCSSTFGVSTRKKFNSRVIIDLIADDIRNMPGITPRDVQSQVKDKFGVDISYYVAWKSTEGGRARIFGDQSQSYSTLAVYLDELERSNPGSAVDLDIDPIKNNFRRCFFAFAACLNGFKSCRPVVMLDGTFMRSKHRGILLTVVGKDGNEGYSFLCIKIIQMSDFV